jgi:hypothetical protein
VSVSQFNIAHLKPPVRFPSIAAVADAVGTQKITFNARAGERPTLTMMCGFVTHQLVQLYEAGTGAPAYDPSGREAGKGSGDTRERGGTNLD